MKVLVALTVALAASTVSDLAGRLDAARRTWDSETILTVQSQIRSDLANVDTAEALMLRARATLAVAEVLRLEFEESTQDREERRLLGERIDAFASDALAQLDLLPETSERERIRADLLATMIRSDYRAKKYEPELKAAIDRALELDPDNPSAHVTAAKPLLFAPEAKGRDVDAAIVHLDRALALDPDLEDARLLRATALEMAGDLTGAREDAQTALAANPDCAPALRLLERLGER